MTTTTNPTCRDVDRERRLLDTAARGHDAFTDHAQQRLATGQELFGDSWSWAGIRRLLTELLEECADVGTWSVLADQAIDLDTDISDLHREQIRGILALVARHGAQAHELLTQAQRSLVAK